MIKGFQINPQTVKQANVEKGYVDLQSDQTVGGAKKFTSAVMTALPVAVDSNAGNFVLTNTSNTFIASGAEDITKFSGWDSGIFTVIWSSARTVKNNTGVIELQAGQDRPVKVGDVSIFGFFGAEYVKELHYFAADPGADAAAYKDEFTIPADNDAVTLPLSAAPSNKAMMMVAVNGSIISMDEFEFAGKNISFNYPLYKGDKISVFQITKSVGQGIGGEFVLDAGNL